MALERFQKQYNIPNLRQILLSENTSQFQEKPDTVYLAAYLAKRFAEFGAEGLRETEADISSKAKAYLINFSPPYNINKSDQFKLGFNYSAVAVGTILEFMADAAKQGVFDKPGYEGVLNSRRKGSIFFHQINSNPLDVRVIKNEHWEQLRRLAEENPTLLRLFTTEYHLLPDFIKEQLEHGQNLELIRKRTLPIYHPVVSKLLTSS